MFGLPPGNELREAVVRLTRDHTRVVGDLMGTEPPLLRLLEIAIGSNTSGGAGGGGRSKNSAPLDVTALALWEEIAEVVGSHWPGRSDPKRKSTHLMDRLTAWTNAVASTENEPHLLEFCVYWEAQIRELLEPSQIVPLRGVACFGCKQTWIMVLKEGENTVTPVLQAKISERLLHGVEVECIACKDSWSGVNLELMGALAS